MSHLQEVVQAVGQDLLGDGVAGNDGSHRGVTGQHNYAGRQLGLPVVQQATHTKPPGMIIVRQWQEQGSMLNVYEQCHDWYFSYS